MPRIPAPSVGRQSVSLVPFSAPNALPFQSAVPAQIARFGEAAQQSSAVFGRLMAEREEQFDEARALEAHNTFSDRVHEQMTSYLSTIGKAAQGGISSSKNSALSQIDKERGRITKMLTSPRQREMFTRAADVTQRNAYFKANEHETTQLQNYYIGQSVAASKNAARDAVGAATPEERAVALGRIRNENGRVAQMRGWSPEQTEDALNVAMADVQTAIVTQILDSQDPQKVKTAREALKSVPDGDLDKATRKALKDRIDRASEDEKAWKLAERLDKSNTSAEDKVAALQALVESGEASPDVAEKALTQLARWEQFRAAQGARDEAKAMDDAKTWAAQNSDKAFWTEAPVEIREALRTSGAAAKFDLWTAGGGQFDTDQEGGNFVLQLLAGDRGATQQLNEIKTFEQLSKAWRHHLSDADFASVSKAWGKLHGGHTAPPTSVDRARDVVRFKMMDSGLLPPMGSVPPSKKTQVTQLQLDRAKRIESTVIDRAQKMDPDGKITDANLTAAYDSVVSSTLRVNGEDVPVDALTNTEVVRVEHVTPYGKILQSDLDEWLVSPTGQMAIAIANEERSAQGLAPLGDDSAALPAKAAILAELRRDQMLADQAQVRGALGTVRGSTRIDPSVSRFAPGLPASQGEVQKPTRLRSREELVQDLRDEIKALEAR